MHSQQMFNECIARTRVVGAGRFPNQHPNRPPPHRKRHFFEETKREKLPSPIRGGTSTRPHEAYLICSTYLPASNSEEKLHNIGLLLLLKFLDIFEGTHLGCLCG